MDQLAFFPSPYPDEDIRSIVFRYHIRAGNGNRAMEHTNKELFGARSERNPCMPRNLDFLIQKLPDNCGLSIQTIVDNHTLFPFVILFITRQKYEQISHEVHHGVTGANHLGSILLTNRDNRLVSEDVRYCLKCMTEDLKIHGECFVHRFHQIQFMNVCHIHSEELLTHCPSCGTRLASKSPVKFPTDMHCPNGHLLDGHRTYRDGKSELDISSQLLMFHDCSLLMQFGSEMTQQDINHRFQIYLGNAGYMNLSGTIRKKEFVYQFSNWLVKNQGAVRVEVKNVKRMFSEAWGLQEIPLYVYLMRFLAGSVELFIRESVSYSIPLPFGSGPWKCKNPICPDLNNDVIKKCHRQLHPSATKISGRFSCPTCGYTYRKRVAAEKFDMVIGRPKVETTGHLHEAVKKILEEQDVSLSHIIHKIQTGAEDIRLMAASLVVSRFCRFPTDYPASAFVQLQQGVSEVSATTCAHDSARRDQNRFRILEVIKSSEGLLRAEIRQRAPGAYIWLMKNDRKWLESTLPKSEVGRVRIDWPIVDREMTLEIEKIATLIYEENPGSQVRKGTIINRLDPVEQGRLSWAKDKLPSSVAALEKAVESREDYLIRHIPQMIEKMRNNRITKIRPQHFMIYRSYQNCSARVMEQINAVLSEQGDGT